MIEKVCCLPPVPHFKGVDLRIKALYNTYGKTLLDVYCQYTCAKVTAVMAVLGSGCTLITFDDADYEELNSFLSVLGVEVFCSSKTAENLTPKREEQICLLEYDGNMPTRSFEKETKVSEIYTLLENGTDGDIVLPPFDEWYADFCLRQNHGSAEYFALQYAVAVCGFKTDDEALITGVAVESEHRNKGFGRSVVEGLIFKLKQKNPKIKILVTATNKRCGFYEKLGFKSAGKVSLLQY